MGSPEVKHLLRYPLSKQDSLLFHTLGNPAQGTGRYQTKISDVCRYLQGCTRQPGQVSFRGRCQALCGHDRMKSYGFDVLISDGSLTSNARRVRLGQPNANQTCRGGAAWSLHCTRPSQRMDKLFHWWSKPPATPQSPAEPKLPDPVPIAPLLSCWDGLCAHAVSGICCSACLTIWCAGSRRTQQKRKHCWRREFLSSFLDAWGAALIDSLRTQARTSPYDHLPSPAECPTLQGLNRRGVLLHLREGHMERLIAPAHVKQVLLDRWGVYRTGAIWTSWCSGNRMSMIVTDAAY